MWGKDFIWLIRTKIKCKILGSYSSDYNFHCLLRCDAMQSGRGTITSPDDGGNVFHGDVGELSYCTVLLPHWQ